MNIFDEARTCDAKNLITTSPLVPQPPQNSMTEIGLLTPVRISPQEPCISGSKEGETVISYWLNVYAPRKEHTEFIIHLLSRTEGEWQKISELYPQVTNLSCVLEIAGEIIFILLDDFNKFPSQIVAISRGDLIRVLREYDRCLTMGIKNASPFLFEYISDGTEAFTLFQSHFPGKYLSD
ncbi:hypothetical protein DFP90_105125 [Aestuariispira insulae]|uniref:Uncharacterized protein n=2 Tax=Aestuariispira insulae TaxID=1461337 RepID=A0A3D9HJX1_9PROT|nr:hypothetical protein DFP90_105125 [Aestuariispira insulae]